MQQPNTLLNLDEIIGGALAERFSGALHEVIWNILDLNTKAEKPRKITLTVSIVPDDKRERATFMVDVKTALQPKRAVATELMLGVNDDGEAVVKEITKQIPGQQALDGTEVTPRIVPIASIK